MRILGMAIEGRTHARILAALVATAVTAMMLAPRASPFYLGILGLVAIAVVSCSSNGRGLRVVAWADPLLAAAGLLALFAFSSVLWAADPAEAAKLSALFGLGIALAAVIAAWVRLEEGERLSRLGLALIIGFALGLAYLAFELLTDQALKRLLFNTLEASRPDSTKNVSVRNGVITSIHPNTLNRQVAALTLLTFPALLAASLWPGLRLRRALLVLLPLGAVLVIALSHHETSKLAIAIGAGVFALHRLMPFLTWQLLRAGWVVAVLGILPLVLAAHQLGLHEAGWVQRTGQARIMLWSVTARETLKSPWIGIGAASTKVIDDRLKKEAQAVPAGSAPAAEGDRDLKSFANRTGRHAHNVYLQTWFELGLVGALMLLAMGLLLIARLARLPSRSLPFAAGFLATGMVMAGLSWGLWQPWFVPVFLLAGMAMIIAARVAERGALQFFAGSHISARSRQAS